MAGAGLYDTVLNVEVSDLDQIRSAVKQVWLSLFNERAIISRKLYKIETHKVEMSLLI